MIKHLWTEGDLILDRGRWLLDTGYSHIVINENHIIQILDVNGAWMETRLFMNWPKDKTRNKLGKARIRYPE